MITFLSRDIHSDGPGRSERRGAVGDEGALGADVDAVGEREAQLGDEELLDVRPADVLRLLDLDHAENLCGSGGGVSERARWYGRVGTSKTVGRGGRGERVHNGMRCNADAGTEWYGQYVMQRRKRTWMERKRARWRAAMSW